MADTFQNIYGGYSTPDRNPTGVGAEEIVGAALRQENDVLNVLTSIAAPKFEPQEGFDYRTVFDPLTMDNEMLEQLSTSTSEGEFNYRAGKMRQEKADKETLAAAGWAGTAAAMASGMVSPTVLIPFAGQARGAARMGQILGLAAAGAGVSEGALFFSQETRTEAELLGGVASQTLFAGLLGGAFSRLSPEAKADFTKRTVANQEVGHVPAYGGKTVEVEIDKALTEVSMAVGGGQRAIPAYRTEPAYVETVTDIKKSLGAKSVNDLPTTGSLSEVLGSEGAVARAKTLGINNLEDLREAVAAGDAWAPEPKALAAYLRASADAVDAGKEVPLVQSNIPQVDVARLVDGRIDELRAPSAVDQTVRTGAEELPAAKTAEADALRAKADKVEQLEAIGAREGENLSAAKAARTRNASGVQRPKSKAASAVLDMFGKINPIYRMAMNKVSPTLRDAAFKLDSAGLRQAELDAAEGSALGGTVISRLKLHDATVAKFLDNVGAEYHRYLFPDADKDPSAVAAALEQVKSNFNMIPEGKLPYGPWKDSVYDHLSTGVVDPSTEKAVKAFKDFFAYYKQTHDDYFKELQVANPEVSRLYKELDKETFGEGITDYAHMIWDGDHIAQNSAEFINDLTNHFDTKFRGEFAKAQARQRTKIAGVQRAIDYAKRSPEEKQKLLMATELEIQRIDEHPDVVPVRQQLADLRAQARDEGWDSKQLSEATKAAKEAAPQAYKDLMDVRKTSMARRKQMRELGGKDLGDLGKYQAELEKADGLLESMFRTEIPAIEKADLSIARIQSKGDRKLNDVSKKLKSSLERMQKRQATFDAAVRKSGVPTQAMEDSLTKAKAKYEEMVSRLDAVGCQQVALDEALSELSLIREFAVKQATTLARSRAVRAADAEEKVAEITSKLEDPESTANYIKRREADLLRMEQDFDQRWYDKGATGSDLMSNDVSFADAALEHATYFMQTVSKQEGGVPSLYLARQAERGPQLMRAFDLPYDIKKKWLNRDVELVARVFDRQMAPDLELWRAFDGNVNGQSVLDAVDRELHDVHMALNVATHVRLPKGLVQIAGLGGKSVGVTKWLNETAASLGKRLETDADISQMEFTPKSFSAEPAEGMVELNPQMREAIAHFVTAQAKSGKTDFDVAIRRLRNTRMAPQDASALGWRSGRFIKELNVTTSMGSVVPSSIADIAMPIWRNGVMGTMKKAWLPFIKNMQGASGKTFRMANSAVNKQIALNIEAATHGRAQSFLDMAEPHARGRTKIERVNKFLSQKTGLVALYDFWTDAQKGMAGAASHATLAEYIPQVAKWVEHGGEETADIVRMRAYLRELGLRDLDVMNIGRQMEQPDGMEVFDGGGRLPNFDLWDDRAAFRAYGAAVQSDVNRTILTPGLERPNIVDENLAWSLVFQFQSFGFAANSRIVMAGLQGNQPYLMQGLLFSLAMGAVSYYAGAASAGGKSLDRANKLDPEEWIYNAVQKSGVMGALSYPWGIAEQIPLLNQLALFGGADQAYRRPVGVVGSLFGPTAGKLERMTEVLKNMDDPEKAGLVAHKLRQIFVPYQNHFLLRRPFDEMESNLLSTLGVSQ